MAIADKLRRMALRLIELTATGMPAPGTKAPRPDLNL